MKKRILLFTAIAGIGSLTISGYQTGAARNGYDCTGAESAGVGSFVNYTGCQAPGAGCHSTTATSTISVAIELDSAGISTTRYKPGMVYSVKITGTNAGASLPKYGFQLNALKGTASTSSNADAGTFAATGLPANTRKSTPSTYTQLTCMEHSTPITLSGTSFSQSFSWTAPAVGTGAISFWGVANFVNGNGNQDAGDLWNTNHITITEMSTAGIANVSNGISVKAYPNPATSNVNIQLDNADAGTYSLQIFDLNGKIIANENISVNGTSHTTGINTSNWAQGVYMVVLQKEGYSKTISVVKR